MIFIYGVEFSTLKIFVYTDLRASNLLNRVDVKKFRF